MSGESGSLPRQSYPGASGDKSTATQRDPLHTPHAHVQPGDRDKKACVKCGRMPDHPMHQADGDE